MSHVPIDRQRARLKPVRAHSYFSSLLIGEKRARLVGRGLTNTITVYEIALTHCKI